jgi:hypothetical protein
MSDGPFRGVFPHQHGDPRSLAERIHAQLRERLQEAVELAGLELMVELRRHNGRPAPETSSDADRREFEHTVRDLLAHLRDALAATLDPAERSDLERAEAEAPEPERLLEGQVLLARQLPDYWQRFETHRIAYAQARLLPAVPRSGWLARLFAGQR